MREFLAQNNNPFGKVAPPIGVNSFGGGNIDGVQIFITVLLRTMIVGAGLYGLISILIAGYTFMSAGGDSKRIEAAWGRIWQTILGLAFAAGSFVIAAILGILLFNDRNAILQLRIFGP